jgi:hypothetical protein
MLGTHSNNGPRFPEFPRWTPQSFDGAVAWLLDSGEALRTTAAAVAPVVEQMLDFAAPQKSPFGGAPAGEPIRPALARLVPWKPTVQTVEPPVLLTVYLLPSPPTADDLTGALRAYLESAWRAQCAAWDQATVPASGLRLLHPVIFVLVYLGNEEWKVALDLDKLQQHPTDLTEHHPKFKVLSLSLKWVKPELLTNAGVFGKVLRVAAVAGRSGPRFLPAYEDVLADMDAMPVTTDAERRRWLWYLIYLMVMKRAAGEFPRLRQALVGAFADTGRRREVDDMLRTIFDSCSEIGELKARRDMLLDLMGVKFGTVPKEDAEHVARIQNLETLTRLLRRVITARDIDDVGLFDAPDAD